METEPILKKTMYTVAVMVAAWVVFVGTVSLIAVAVTSHAVAPPESKAPGAAESKGTLGQPPIVPSMSHRAQPM
jgi:hypothetical protein